MLLGLVLSLVSRGAKTEREENDQPAVKMVEKLGGKVWVDAMQPGKIVVGVRLSFTKVTDAELKELKELKGLQELNLWGTKVSDVGMKELKELKSLQLLDLNQTNVTDAGLKELKKLTNLQSLNLMYTKVTDAGLKELKELNRLQELNLCYTKVTDVGMLEAVGPQKHCCNGRGGKGTQSSTAGTPDCSLISRVGKGVRNRKQ